MRIGISIGTIFDPKGPGGHREGPRAVVAQAQAAASAGLNSLSLGDHHSTGAAGYVQNVPVLGRILADWTEGQVGCLFLFPLWNPVLMAEQIGTLAAMGPGPFIVQTGLGAGSRQFQAMGVNMGERAVRLEEGIRVVQSLLRGETIDSDLFGLRAAQIAPLPPDGTEWWIGGGAAKAIDRAARLGDCWYGNADLTPQSAARTIDIYREACDRHRRIPARIPIRKDVFIAEDRAQAEKVGHDLVSAGYRGFERGAVAYGDPQSVAEQLSIYETLGFTDVIVRVMGPLPSELGDDAAVRTVELAGEVQSILSRSGFGGS